MKEQQATQILQELAEQEVPASLDLWPAIQAQLQPRRSSRWAQVLPATRLGWAFLVLSLFLVIGATAYAVNLWEVMPFWRPIEEAGLGQEVHLSQTLNGFTVTLERVYADANQVLVGFTVRGPSDQRVHLTEITLTDDQGTVFPGMLGAGVVNTSDILGVSLPPGTQGEVFTFDASAVQGTPSELKLHLEMALWIPVTDQHATPTVEGEMPAQEPQAQITEGESTTVMATPAQTMRDAFVAGPFTFAFSVPFIPGRTVEVSHTVEAGGVAITLQRVVVTPSETRAILCFDPPDGGGKAWTPIAMLDAGEGQEVSGGSSSLISGTGEERCHRYGFFASLYNQRGEWTLTVPELVGMDIGGLESRINRQADSAALLVDAAEFQTRLAGPWVFRFRVP